MTTISHPTLPPDQTQTVTRDAFDSVLAPRGWVEVVPESAVDEPADEPAAKSRRRGANTTDVDLNKETT